MSDEPKVNARTAVRKTSPPRNALPRLGPASGRKPGAGSRWIILGLDGLSWPLLKRLTGDGTMPRLAALLNESSAGPMNSSWPEISPVAWTSFFTADGPGGHGIYGFTEFKPNSYQVRFNSSGSIRRPCLWDWLSLKGLRSIVLNVPLTYPARDLNGVMVSGFIALDYERAVHPPSLADSLRRTGYRLEADFEKVHKERSTFLGELDQALSGRGMLLDRFWGESWELMVLVVTDTDRLYHFFLREFEEGGPIEPYFRSFHRRVDELLGTILDRMDRDGKKTTRLIMLSDHGFVPITREFHLNRWLARNGFQKELGPEALALALDPTRIYLNRKPRFPGARLGSGDAGPLIRDLAAALRAEPAVDDVLNGPDLYTGPRAETAPDLVIKPAPGYEFKAKFNPGRTYTSSPLQGTHSWENAFYLVRNKDGEPVPVIPDIASFGKYVFSLLGISRPS